MTTLVEAFLAQARRTPAVPALAVGEEVLSYRELETASAELAGRLAAAGARPGSVVCIHLPQQAATFVAMLASLRAGCTWSIVEPEQPAGRLRALLADTDCAVILHAPGGADALRARLADSPDRTAAGVTLLAADTPTGAAGPTATVTVAVPVTPVPATAAPASAAAPTPAVRVPESLPAYVIYTSGSTGRPKGVLVSRAQLAASVFCREWLYGPEPPIFVDLMRFSFDGSLAAAFWTVTRGGTLVVPAEDQLRDPAAGARLAERHRATHLIAVPSFYRLLLPHAGRLPVELRLAALGGEPCTADLVTTHRSALPAVELVNEYGPTETVVSCTAHRVRRVPAASAPIGRPHPGATVQVLDEKLRPQPTGAIGELYVGGAFPATGYAGQAARTAERFVADPFADRPGGRLYRTGDLVSWNADGELEFHGRADDQLKVRGHRVELGEIARVLERHPRVARAEVVPADAAGEPELVAFLEVPADGGPAPDAGELREHCRRQLPEPAVPARFEPVEALPISRTGKVDRAQLLRRLARPERRRPAPSTDTPGQAGWNDLQRTLWSMWRAVLGHDEAGLRDNFFEQGGTSLKLIDLHNRMEQQWPGALRVGELFDLTTVEAQARAIHERTGRAEAAAQRLPVASFEL